MSRIPERASQPFALGPLTLRNRIVGAPHGRGMLDDGLALPGDADYWRRVAAGGAAMVTVGGTTTAPESTWRRRIVTEAWRADGIPGLALRAEAIRSEGAVASPPDRPSRARDHGRRDVVRAGGAVVGALAARADAPGGTVGGGRGRGRGGISHLERQRRAGRLPSRRAARGSRLFARPVPIAIAQISVPAPPQSPSGCRSSAGSRGRSANRLRS